MTISAEKRKSLQSALAGINKQFGAGAANFVKDIYDDLRIKFYKTPSYEFNIMLGGGVGKGKIVEFYGENSSGKTSMALETIAHQQKIDPDFVGGWFETEESFDPDYARDTFGIDMERFVYWDQKDTGAEQGLDILRGLVASGQFGIIVVNSVAGLTPKKEIEDDLDKQNIALQARIMSKLMRVITGAAGKTGTTLIFINQLRTNVGQMFGDPNTTTGGKALSYYASQRVGMRKVKLQAGDALTADEGIKVTARTAKNRMAKGNPYMSCDYFARYGSGIDSLMELPDILTRENIVRKAGSWIYWEDENGKPYTFNGVEMKFKSKTVFIEYLQANEGTRQQLEKILDETLAQGKVKGVGLSDEEIKELEASNAAIEEEFSAIEQDNLELVEE